MIDKKIEKQIGGFLGVFLVIASIYFLVLTVAQLKKMPSIGNPEPVARTITVEGRSRVQIEPDLSVINLGIRVENEDSSLAQAENNELVNNILRRLNEVGIEQNDLRTMNYNLRENRVWNPSNGNYEMRGWIVDQNLEVKVRDMSIVGEVLSLAREFAITDINGPNFQLDDRKVYRERARELAIADAKKTAEELSRKLNIKLGKVIGFDEWEEFDYYQPPMREAMVMDSSYGMPDLASGSEEIVLNVNITYELR